MASRGIQEADVEITYAFREVENFEKKVKTDIARVASQVKSLKVPTSNFLPIASLKKYMNSVKDPTESFLEGFRKNIPLGKDKIIPTKLINSELSSLDKAFKKLDMSVMKETDNMAKVASKNFKKIHAATKPVKREFQGWAMSIMFAGMAVQQATQQIWAASTKTFQDVMHSTEGTVTGFDMLDGSVKYLGFSIGQALEPIAFQLIPIIDKITEWVIANEDVVRSAISMGAVFGAGSFLFGSLILAKEGFAELADKIARIPMSAEALKNYDWSGVRASLSKGIGMISIGYGLYQAADAFNDFTSNKFSDAFTNALSSALLTIGGIKMLKGTGGGYLLAIGMALELIETNTLFTTISAVGGTIVAFFATIVKAIGAEFENGIGNALIRGVSAAIDNIIGILPSGLFTTIFGKSPGKMLTELAGLESKAPDFDFFKTYKEEYARTIIGGQMLDQMIKDAKDSVDAEIARQKATMTSSTGEGLTSENLAARNADFRRQLGGVGPIQLTVNVNGADAQTVDQLATRVGDVLYTNLSSVMNSTSAVK